jgi:hypothetical protein
MKLSIVISLVACTTVALIACNESSRSKSSNVAPSSKSQTLEERLATLKTCGLELAAPFTVNDLLKSWKRSDYEEGGFETVLVGLGMTEEQEPWRPHSVNLWHFDTEAIEDDGDYKKIAERMVEISQGSLPLTNIQDHVDVEGGKAWLSFDFKGKPIRMDCAVKDDWVDPTIFGKFVDLLNQSDPSKIYIYYDLGGQDCIIGCVTKTDFECLKSKGIKFVPLT